MWGLRATPLYGPKHGKPLHNKTHKTRIVRHVYIFSFSKASVPDHILMCIFKLKILVISEVIGRDEVLFQFRILLVGEGLFR